RTWQHCPRFGADQTVVAGDQLLLGGVAWEALAAPGHAPHALLLWCENEGILISGDALWSNGFGVVFAELAGEPGFTEVGATLDLIATLVARLVSPGHGAPFTDVDAAMQGPRSRLHYLAA